MTKIISFCPVNEALRDAVRAQGYDSDLIYSNAPVWAEAVADIDGWLADPHMVLDDLGGDIDSWDSINNLFGEIWAMKTRGTLHVFIAPLDGGASAVVRAKLAADLATMNDIHPDQDKPAMSALYVWDGATLREIDLDAHT
jgi:hypothetical protein